MPLPARRTRQPPKGMSDMAAEDYRCRECKELVLYLRDHDPKCVYYVNPNDPFRGHRN